MDSQIYYRATAAISIWSNPQDSRTPSLKRRGISNQINEENYKHLSRTYYKNKDQNTNKGDYLLSLVPTKEMLQAFV